MKRFLTAGGFIAGLAYGTLAIAKVYATSPLPLQVTIVLGVAGVGAGAGWLLGAASDAFTRR